MKIANILEENNMLYEQHALNYQATIANTCIGLNALQETITVGVFTDLLPAVRSSVITPSVNELTENKLLLDTQSLVESINQTLNYADRWKNTPAKVDNFDYRFNVLENEIFAKLGESSAIKTHLDKLYEYATYNHKHDALILGLLSATASIENGSVGHTIAEQLLTSYIPISSEYAVEHVQQQYVPSRPLSEGRIYLLIDNVCNYNTSMVSDRILVNVTESTNFSGRRYTTLVTSDQLRSAWMEAGQPQDAGQVAVLLSECGINSRVIYNTCNDMQIYLNESALQALNEGPFGNFLAKGAAAVGKGIGAVAGGLRGMVTPIKTGYAAGRAAVEKYGAPDGGQATQAPGNAAPTGVQPTPAPQAPAKQTKAKQTKATSNRAFDTIASSIQGMDLASKKRLLTALQQQVQAAPATTPPAGNKQATPAPQAPATTPPATTPPATTPPATTPPAGNKQATTPPATTPPAGNKQATTPPAGNKQATTPPATTPPAGNKQATTPPANSKALPQNYQQLQQQSQFQVPPGSIPVNNKATPTPPANSKALPAPANSKALPQNYQQLQQQSQFQVPPGSIPVNNKATPTPPANSKALPAPATTPPAGNKQKTANSKALPQNYQQLQQQSQFQVPPGSIPVNNKATPTPPATTPPATTPPAPASNSEWDVIDAPAKPPKQKPSKYDYNNSDIIDVEATPVQPQTSTQAMLPAPAQQSAPAKKQPPPRKAKAASTPKAKRNMPPIPSNEALYRSIKNELLESYKAYKKMR